MLPYVTNQLADYENDPVVVTALREASHHTLYAVAHSVAMNGVGEDTTINLTRPVVLTVLQAGYIIFGILFVGFSGSVHSAQTQIHAEPRVPGVQGAESPEKAAVLRLTFRENAI